MRSVVVVVPLVFGRNTVGVGCVDNQHVVEDFSAQGADDSFAVGVCLGCLWWCLQDFDVVCLEDGVEGTGVLGVAVADEESRGFCAGTEVVGQVASLLGDPLAGGMGGVVGDVETAGAVMEEHQGVEAL
jgi:hypothetical protein